MSRSLSISVSLESQENNKKEHVDNCGSPEIDRLISYDIPITPESENHSAGTHNIPELTLNNNKLTPYFKKRRSSQVMIDDIENNRDNFDINMYTKIERLITELQTKEDDFEQAVKIGEILSKENESLKSEIKNKEEKLLTVESKVNLLDVHRKELDEQIDVLQTEKEELSTELRREKR
eukprot:UN34695